MCCEFFDIFVVERRGRKAIDKSGKNSVILTGFIFYSHRIILKFLSHRDCNNSSFTT